MMEALPLLEILPVNGRVTEREFVPLARVERIMLDKIDGVWAALLVDGKTVILKDAPA